MFAPPPVSPPLAVLTYYSIAAVLLSSCCPRAQPFKMSMPLCRLRSKTRRSGCAKRRVHRRSASHRNRQRASLRSGRDAFLAAVPCLAVPAAAAWPYQRLIERLQCKERSTCTSAGQVHLQRKSFCACGNHLHSTPLPCGGANTLAYS